MKLNYAELLGKLRWTTMGNPTVVWVKLVSTTFGSLNEV